MGINHGYMLSALPFWAIRPAIRYYYGNVWNELPDKAKVLFIHIPKCAGTSVTRVLYDKDMGHRPAALYLAADSVRFNSIPSFAIIRNPYDRFCSIFNHNRCPRYDTKIELFEERLYSRFHSACEFAHALGCDKALSNSFMSHILARPQSEWIKVENRIYVDYLFAYEQLNKLEAFLNNHLGESSLRLPHANASGRTQEWEEELDERAKDIIYDMYQEDFEVWESLKQGMIEISYH